MQIRDDTCIVYDIETLRNCFTCTTYNTETSAIVTFEISERKNELIELVDFFLQNNIIFVGYNNHHFDDPVMNYIIMYNEILQNKPTFEINRSIFNLTQIIINEDSYEKWLEFKYAKIFKSLDLLTMYFSKALRVSLKEIQITMMYKNVKEFIIDWLQPIEKSRIPELIEYNINDVMSTTQLLEDSKEHIDLRISIENEYNVNVLSRDGMKIGITVLENLYSKKTGILKKDFINLRSIRHSIKLNECILPIISYNNKNLSELLEKLKSSEIFNTKSELDYNVLYSENLYSIGTGGIHTKDEPAIIKPKEDELLIDSDVNSYYPSLLIEWGFYPEHLGEVFLDVYKQIYYERLAAKAKGDKNTAETLKLSLNGTYGNLINEYSWLFDRKAAMSITINGQLLLLMLAEMLTEIGCKVVSANTDGLTCIVKKKDLEEHKKVCEKWSKLSKMTLEHVQYTHIARLAVNDYLAVKEGYYETKSKKNIKEKGIFITEARIGKGLSPLIIPKALQEYFLHNIPIEETIRSCKDVKQFLMSEKTGKQWTVEHDGIQQQRVNRFIASINAPYLMKWKEQIHEIRGKIKSYSNMLVDSGVIILNDLENIKDISEYRINYPYYISQCRKILDKIEPKQLRLFE